MTSKAPPSPPASSPRILQPRVVGIVALLLVCFSVLAFFGYRWASRETIATLTEFSGEAERDTADHLERWRGAAVGDEFQIGDGARTADSSSAHFKVAGGAKLRLRPSSVIRFLRSSQGRLKVDVSVGQVDVETGDGAGLTIDSEFGELVLDAQSSITMSRDGAQLNVDVELGSLQFGGRGIKAGDRVELEFGGIVVDPAAPPEPVPTATAAPTAAAAEAEAPPLRAGNGVASADLVVGAGETFVVHDPSPPTAVGFRTSGVCDGPARLTSGKQFTEVVDQGNLQLPRGEHPYEVRCLSAPDVVAARGTVRVLQDAGTRQLPTFTPSANVVTDGRRYTVLYQHRLPTVTVTWPTAPAATNYTLQVGSRKIVTKSPSHTFRSLPRGSHTAVFTATTTPVRQSRSTTIEVVYDTQAPAARVSDPPQGFTPGEPTTINGQALPGWNVSVGGAPVAVDEQNNFSVAIEGNAAVPITFSHPERGTHYYLRRPKAVR